ncbi:hypothetical protein ACFY9Q_01305 [Streptomyces sp. NPDC012389]|uniref:hypothetical protein n=1 Tax=Streptomyces sp. NPDC012389 TaxID=3364830 RepID=UPI0036E17E41
MDVPIPTPSDPTLFVAADQGSRWKLAGTDADGGRLFVPELVDPEKTPRWVWAREAELVEVVGELVPFGGAA